MIVVDASAVIALLLHTPSWPRLHARLLDGQELLYAPHILDVEVAQVIRRYNRARELQGDQAGQALNELLNLPLIRYPHMPLLPRMWELRHHLTAYDAAYVALAEALEAPLVTCDRRLATAPGHHAVVEVVG